MAFTSQFTLAEILSLLGLAQSIYVLVYMLLRSGSLINAVIPSLYFASIAAAFLFDAAGGRWAREFEHYEAWQWLFWFSGIPLGILLIFQIANVTQKPRGEYFFLLLLIPVSFLPGYFMDEPHVYYVSGLIIGALCLLAVWLRRDLMDGLHGNPKFGEERFWLIIALIALNAAFLASTLAYVSQWIGMQDWMVIRTLLGIAFVYIAATSLFRIYPQALRVTRSDLSGPVRAEDQIILERLNILFEREKIYQDAAYGRAELARELQVGEANLSRLVNLYHGKTIPQLLNEYRVKDAQKLLRETDATIQNVFEESGFSSITTFNRVFKELSGDIPKDYRARHRL